MVARNSASLRLKRPPAAFRLNSGPQVRHSFPGPFFWIFVAATPRRVGIGNRRACALRPSARARRFPIPRDASRLPAFLPSLLPASAHRPTWKQDKPETQADRRPVGRVDADAIRRPAAVGAVESHAPPRTTRCEPRGSSTHALPSAGAPIVIPMPVILAPFPYIAVHIMQTETVWLLFPHRVETLPGIITIPSCLVQIFFFVALVISGCGTRTAGVLPLCFGRQIQPSPFCEFFRVVPNSPPTTGCSGRLNFRSPQSVGSPASGFAFKNRSYSALVTG